MYLTVKNTPNLSGKIIAPSSKSHSIRGIVISLLAKGKSTLLNVLDSEDTQAAIKVCATLGAEIHVTGRCLTITSSGLPLNTSATEINTGNSGITTLFILPVLGLREDCTHSVLLNCGEQMRARPIKSLIEALCHLGMNIDYVSKKDQLPVYVTGRLKGGVAEVEGINSQYLSGLLISLPCAENDSVITVKHLHERPYIDMTLDYLREQGINYVHQSADEVDIFYIQGRQEYIPLDHTIPGDFSSASYLMAAAVLCRSEIELHGLNYADTQGDKKLISVLQKMGADMVIKKNAIQIHGGKPLTGMRIDANDMPDLVPTLAVIATQAKGKTDISNVKQARIKETDRIHSMTEGLRKMGAHIVAHEDGMTIYESSLQGAFVNGYGDHRTVMALTVAGMVAQGRTLITEGESVKKTYPKFVETMQRMGANLSIDNPPSQGHIILIGFKHVGKTLIGNCLAKTLNKKFIDLDKEIENSYRENNLEALNSRQIMQSYGESYYRELESQNLERILKSPSCVISLGGGAALNLSNQLLIQSHMLLHVVAPPGIVFERIMVEGRPAFFSPNEEPYESFSRLWKERSQIYTTLTTHLIDNSGTVEEAVNEAILHLHQQQENSRYA
jgi:3-phosphoshikimate 1-carboxyvinyltransferase